MQRRRVWRLSVQHYNTINIHPSFKSGYIGISFWVAFSTRGRMPLVLIDGTRNLEKYQAILEAHVIPFSMQHYGCTENMVYQQDICGPHPAKSIASYMEAKRMNAMK